MILMTERVISKKNQIRSILLVIILMVITAVVILKGYPLKEIIGVIKNVKPFYLISGIGMMVLYASCQAMNFHLIMKTLGKSVQFKNCFEYAYIGNYFNAITPGASGGQPAQVYYMTKDKVNFDLSTITIFFMVFASQLVILLMGGVMAFWRRSILAGSVAWFRYLLLAGGLVMLGLIILLLAFMFSKRMVPFLIHLAFKIGDRLHLLKKPEEMRVSMEALLLSYRNKSTTLLKHPILFVKVFFVTLLQWVAFGMVSYLVYLSFGHREHGIVDLMTCQAFINIAVSAVPLPGSVGIAENSFLHLFGQFYSEQELASAMILSRMVNFYLPLVIGFVVYLLAHNRIVNRKGS